MRRTSASRTIHLLPLMLGIGAAGCGFEPGDTADTESEFTVIEAVAVVDTSDPSDTGALHPQELPEPELPEGVAMFVTNEDIYSPSGPLHEVTVGTPEGILTTTAVEGTDGNLYVGDMNLGHKSVVIPTPTRAPPGTSQATAIPQIGKRWPNGVVPYTVDPWLGNPNWIAAMNHIEARTPIRFVPRTNQSDYVRFVNSGESGWSFSKVGRVGGRQDIQLWTTHGKGTVAHEILHALGVKHEQQRPDRDDYIDVIWDCIIDDKEGNFQKYTGGLTFGPFDFDSIMLYNSFSAVVPPSEDPWCAYTMVLDGTNTPFGNQRTGLSPTDANGIYHMYGQGLGANESYDHFGRALATGDYDADGYIDLAIGAPGEAPGSDPKSGVVYLYKGTAAGLVPWMYLSQESAPPGSTPLGVNENGDEFGYALATGDFNNDGIDDLAVGAPGEQPPGGGNNAGAVFIYRGYESKKSDDRQGLRPDRALTQGNSGAGADEADDRFGQALAAGNLNGAGGDELIVGAPGEKPGSAPDAGYVFVFRKLLIGTWTFWEGYDQTGLALPDDADDFGFSLTAGDFNGDGVDDFAVGSPHDSNWGTNSGAVFLFKGRANLKPVAWKYVTETLVGAANEAGDLFGYSLAAGDFDGDGIEDLAVGGPGENNAQGRVYLYRGQPGANTGEPIGWQILGQSGLGQDEAGDKFGYSLSVGYFNTDNKADLAVGAPRETSGGVQAGMVFAFKGSNGGMTAWDTATQAGMDASEDSDILGATLATGDFNGDGRDDIASGAWKEGLDSKTQTGAVYIWRSGYDLHAHMMVTQEMKPATAP